MKDRLAAELARKVAERICDILRQDCVRIEIAGSLRRRQQTVGDIEIVYISRTAELPDPDNMFEKRTVSLADSTIGLMVESGLLERRKTILGREVYGPKNKLMRHPATGIPVDLFATVESCWWNYLVVRTGPKASNERIAAAAKRRGWRWHAYGEGFEVDGRIHHMHSEAAVFEFVGLPYHEPWQRT